MAWRPLTALCIALFTLAACGTAPPEPVFVSSAPPSVAASSPAETPPAAPVTVTAPSNVEAGVAVFDRKFGVLTAQLNPDKRFRSASLVKLFIALDYLWTRGPEYKVADADRHNFEIMLRGSDDNAATYFWQKAGGEVLIGRMVTRLGLKSTKPPTAENLHGWGSTTLTANDLVLLYRYLFEQAPAGMRDTVMAELHQFTTCGTDKYFQAFGIPSAYAKPWAAKHGWWGFGDIPAQPCSGQAPPQFAAPGPVTGKPASMMNGEVLHSTGTVGEGDRYIVVVLTHYPSGAKFTDAMGAITTLARSLPLPAGLKIDPR